MKIRPALDEFFEFSKTDGNDIYPVGTEILSDICTPIEAKKMSSMSDGAIVGSAIIKIIEEHGKDSAEFVADYVKKMKSSVNSAN